MSLAIFDLDNTLLDGDSDYLWGQFLCERGLVDAAEYECRNQEFYDLYKQGELDIHEFLQFSLAPLSQHSMAQLHSWHEEFMRSKIEPIILEEGRKLIDAHRRRGDTLLIITATNRFVTGPIAEALDVPHLLATEAEIIDDQYTGRVTGTPCFQEGKVERLEEWMTQHGEDLEGSWFYSDSHNDLPLLERVSNAVAVDPDPILCDEAKDRRWKIISLRDNKKPCATDSSS